MVDVNGTWIKYLALFIDCQNENSALFGRHLSCVATAKLKLI